jgi:predicted nucleotidyltransferase
MSVRDVVLASLERELPFLRREFGVSRIGLFGSVDSGTDNLDSDVDLVVEFSETPGFRFMELGDYLEEVLKRRVDLLTPTGIRKSRLTGIRALERGGVSYV